MDIYYWEKFYEDSVKPQIDKKGEAYIEWLTSKQSLVKQLNYLRAKYKLKIVWFKKESNPDWTCIFIKLNIEPTDKVIATQQAMP